MTIDDVKAELARGQGAAVEMLDRWASKGYRSWYVEHQFGDKWRCGLLDNEREGRYVYGDSPEAARANAAESVRHEL